jgi:hypothetical protein
MPPLSYLVLTRRQPSPGWALDEQFTGFALSRQRIEILLEALLERFPRIYTAHRAQHGDLALFTRPLPVRPVKPKKEVRPIGC